MSDRYRNTDFVLYWVLCHMSADLVAITYDIACQYSKHFRLRILALQEYIRAQIAALPAELRALNHPNFVGGNYMGIAHLARERPRSRLRDREFREIPAGPQ